MLYSRQFTVSVMATWGDGFNSIRHEMEMKNKTKKNGKKELHWIIQKKKKFIAKVLKEKKQHTHA